MSSDLLQGHTLPLTTLRVVGLFPPQRNQRVVDVSDGIQKPGTVAGPSLLVNADGENERFTRNFKMV